jgi:hypothetical protein
MPGKYFIRNDLRADYCKQAGYGAFLPLKRKPRRGTGAFLISNLIIEDWVELNFNRDIIDL